MTSFLTTDAQADEPRVLLYGLPFEPIGSLRGGASDGPAAIRRASRLLTSFVARLDRDFAQIGMVDAGDLPRRAELLESALRQPFERATPAVLMGGDHSLSRLTVPAAAVRHPELAVVAFGAHLDAEAAGHACWGQVTGELLGDGSIWYVGARAFTRPERDYARNSQRLLPLYEVDLVTAARTAANETAGRPVYLSLSLDVLDPACAPAVTRPAGLGATAAELWQALELFEAPVGLEVVDLTPRLDPGLSTALLAAELIRDMSVWWWGR